MYSTPKNDSPASALRLASWDPSNGNLSLNEEALHVIGQFDTQVAVVVVAGKYRSGKSYLINQFLDGANINSINDPQSISGFEVSSKTKPCTQGILLWSKPVMTVDASGDQLPILILDTEGLGSHDRSSQQEMKLFAFVILLSSYFIFNSVGMIDEDALEQLALVAELSNHISVRSKQSSGDVIGNDTDNSELADFFPAFMWVLRDFSLELISADRERAMSSNQYLETALKKKEGANEHVKMANQVRTSLTRYFKEKSCTTLIRPVDDEALLKRLISVGRNQLRPKFVEQVVAMITTIKRTIRPKSLFGHHLTGRQLAALSREYAKVINTGGIPAIQDSWDNVWRAECKEALSLAQRMFTKGISKLVLPMEVDELCDIIDDGCTRAELLFRKRAMGSDKEISQFLDELRLFVTGHRERLLADNEEASERSCEELLNILSVKINEGLNSHRYELGGIEGVNDFEKDRRSMCESYIKEAKGPASKTKLFEWVEKIMSRAILNLVGAAEERGHRRAAELVKVAKEHELATNNYKIQLSQLNEKVNRLEIELEQAREASHGMESLVAKEKAKTLAEKERERFIREAELEAYECALICLNCPVIGYMAGNESFFSLSADDKEKLRLDLRAAFRVGTKEYSSVLQRVPETGIGHIELVLAEIEERIKRLGCGNVSIVTTTKNENQNQNQNQMAVRSRSSSWITRSRLFLETKLTEAFCYYHVCNNTFEASLSVTLVDVRDLIIKKRTFGSMPDFFVGLRVGEEIHETKRVNGAKVRIEAESSSNSPSSPSNSKKKSKWGSVKALVGQTKLLPFEETFSWTIKNPFARLQLVVFEAGVWNDHVVGHGVLDIKILLDEQTKYSTVGLVQEEENPIAGALWWSSVGTKAVGRLTVRCTLKYSSVIGDPLDTSIHSRRQISTRIRPEYRDYASRLLDMDHRTRFICILSHLKSLAAEGSGDSIAPLPDKFSQFLTGYCDRYSVRGGVQPLFHLTALLKSFKSAASLDGVWSRDVAYQMHAALSSVAALRSDPDTGPELWSDDEEKQYLEAEAEIQWTIEDTLVHFRRCFPNNRPKGGLTGAAMILLELSGKDETKCSDALETLFARGEIEQFGSSAGLCLTNNEKNDNLNAADRALNAIKLFESDIATLEIYKEEWIADINLSRVCERAQIPFLLAALASCLGSEDLSLDVRDVARVKARVLSMAHWREVDAAGYDHLCGILNNPLTASQKR